jgi:nucleoside 2-deoxyribosyltransferase
MTLTVCPICLSIDGFTRSSQGDGVGRGGTLEECELCGSYFCTREALSDYLGQERANTTRLARAVLSHWVQQRQNADEWPVVDKLVAKAAIDGDLPLPSPGDQVSNIIRFVGDSTRDTGEPLRSLPPSFHATIGSVTRIFAIKLVQELCDGGLLRAIESNTLKSRNVQNVELTIAGWEQYEAERRGKTAGSYGFLALKFGDEVLDPFVQSHIKPAVAELGFELRDMRDGARAGVIDNLMRIDIRDAAFVIADLTHDNAGSYWEAGYAEGLGKPVLYICEKSKFGAVKTHFDTNHSTTVQWDVDDPEAFKRDLIATLQRSLIL